jgi:hypothetical protein
MLQNDALSCDNAGDSQAGDHVNIVYMPYCDGAIYCGRRAGAVTQGEESIYSRGAFNFEATISHLISTQNLNQVIWLVVVKHRCGGDGR